VQDQIKKMGYSTFSIQDASKGLSQFFLFLDLFLGIFGSLALAVASLGIVNTLVMAILERRREIGIMKALGASDFDVKKLFFVEAGVMGVVGGLLGITIGWLIGRVINIGTNMYMANRDIPAQNYWIVSWWLVALALGFSVVVSLLAGMYPAARAAKLDPVQALRHD
jgi:putative ABC transport system permease protein